ncbi:MAG: Xaa-Pro aminopeptidase [Gammaproteobacteria bacterium]|nr:Xaa-Pro aminopeptidase [Gammaproteobacteria bacterium]
MNQTEFSSRREYLMNLIGNDNIAIIPGASEVIRNNDAGYRFRQDSDFYYLTGFEEPDALAVFIPGREQGEYILFCREFDETRAVWTGQHAGLEGACGDFNADDAFPIDDVDDILPGMLENKERVFYPMGRNKQLDQSLIDWLAQLRSKTRTGVHAPSEIVSLEHVTHEMRLIKSSWEIDNMRESARIAAAAHCRAMRHCMPGLYEYHVEAELMHEFMSNGIQNPAYTSIVAGGHHACVLHYIDNNDQLGDGDLLLIDAGAEYRYYASDITRTFPINGTFNTAQRSLYELVLDAQVAAIEQIYPGNSWNVPHETAVSVLTSGLIKLGLLQGDKQQLIEEEAYKMFYMHRTGHWLGMDVHDVGDYKIDDEWRIFEPGMTLTVEPGLYISEQSAVDSKWKGIGIRIEDDVLVTERGHEILSANVPKSVADVESMCAG